jgi:hypothetical protein
MVAAPDIEDPGPGSHGISRLARSQFSSHRTRPAAMVSGWTVTLTCSTIAAPAENLAVPAVPPGWLPVFLSHAGHPVSGTLYPDSEVG